MIDFMPGGNLVFQALDNARHHRSRWATWLQEQINTLGMAASSLRQALDRFLDSLGWTDIFDLGGVWDRAKRIFTEPIDRIINFAGWLVSGILTLHQRRHPAAGGAPGRRHARLRSVCAWSWARIRSPAMPYPRTAETLIGGFMRLIGQEEIWQHMQQSRASRARGRGSSSKWRRCWVLCADSAVVRAVVGVAANQ